MAEQFNLYAKYYDLLYKEKNYSAEADYVEKIIKKFAKGTKKILNLGCGTGRHDIEFAGRDYDVTAIEMSPMMLKIAKRNVMNLENRSKVKLHKGDMRKVQLNKKFDAVLSLFHVMSYQVTNEDMKKSLENVKRHLKNNGVFIFDFWYGPAVLNEKPEVRKKKIDSQNIKIERSAFPVLKVNENKVEVNYKVVFVEKKTGKKEVVSEKHNMRYFFLPEINMFLEDAGLTLLYCREWMTDRELTDGSWSAVAVARNNPKKNFN